MAIVGATALTPDPENVNVIGAVPGGIGPAEDAQDLLDRPGAAIVDERLGVDEGDTITLSGMEFEVVAERSGGRISPVCPLSSRRSRTCNGSDSTGGPSRPQS